MKFFCFKKIHLSVGNGLGATLFLFTLFPLLFSCSLNDRISRIDSLKNVVYCKQIKDLSTGKPNTVYIIQSNIDFHGETVSIPQNSTLRFIGGLLSNGAIFFQNTKLEGKVNIQCDISGSISNDTIYVDWFINRAKNENEVHDLSYQIQSVFDLGAPIIIFGEGYYHFSNINIGSDVEIVGRKSVIVPIVLNQDKFTFSFLKNVFYAKNAKRVCVRGFRFRGHVTGNMLPNFTSSSIFGEPLIWIDNADKVIIDSCIFENIENCTYCNSAYTYYGKKQGSCVCLWDVSDASYTNCEQFNCRHDEQVWIIAVKKPIMETVVTYKRNYVHDMSPGPNSSAFTCVTGLCYMEDNRVDNYSYPGSMFNLFAKKLFIRNNTIKNSYCSSVFDACEYSYFHNDEIVVENNNVDAINAVLLLGQSEKVTIKNNIFRGLGLYYSANGRVSSKGNENYQYWYTDAKNVLPTDAETIIERNECNLTAYDGNRSIAGTEADYGSGKILKPQKYNNVGVNYGCGILIHPTDAKAGSISVVNNTFTTIESLEGKTDKNNLAEIFPHAIRLVNTENVIIKGNTFNGCYRLYQNPNEYTCISIYNYPDVMEKMDNPIGLSKKPTEYGSYVVEDNVFNIQPVDAFYPVSIYARVNSYRQTPLTIRELVIRNNRYINPSSKSLQISNNKKSKSNYINSGPVRIIKEVN